MIKETKLTISPATYIIIIMFSETRQTMAVMVTTETVWNNGWLQDLTMVKFYFSY
jgi:hypothetical protein